MVSNKDDMGTTLMYPVLGNNNVLSVNWYYIHMYQLDNNS